MASSALPADFGLKAALADQRVPFHNQAPASLPVVWPTAMQCVAEAHATPVSAAAPLGVATDDQEPPNLITDTAAGPGKPGPVSGDTSATPPPTDRHPSAPQHDTAFC